MPTAAWKPRLDKRANAAITAELFDKIANYAQTNAISPSDVVRRALEKYLENEEGGKDD